MWLKIIRPGTLFSALVPVAIGVAFAAQQHTISWWVALIIALTAAFIQIFSNLINDYYDYKKGDDGADRLGPIRAVSAGIISVSQLKKAIYTVAILALAGGIALIYIGGWPILTIGASALLFAWLYSATSFSLSRLGIADLFVLIYFGPVATMGTYYLLTHSVTYTLFWIGLGCGLISMAVLTVNNIRDYAQDKANHKRTLIVRLGITFGRCYYAALILLPSLSLLLLRHWPCILIYLLFAATLLWRFLKAEGRGYNTILVNTGMLNLIYGLTAIWMLYL